MHTPTHAHAHMPEDSSTVSNHPAPHLRVGRSQRSWAHPNRHASSVFTMFAYPPVVAVGEARLRSKQVLRSLKDQSKDKLGSLGFSRYTATLSATLQVTKATNLVRGA